MNAIKSKLLLTLAKNKKKDEGFTLIELLVVIIIIGVLSAVALPNLLGQVGKARESEAKNGVGAINRAQQAYFTENGAFAFSDNSTTDLQAVRDTLGVGIQTEFYDTIQVQADNAADPSTAGVFFANDERANDGTRDYAGLVGFFSSSQAFASGICRASDVNTKISSVDITFNSSNGDTDAECGSNLDEVN